MAKIGDLNKNGKLANGKSNMLQAQQIDVDPDQEFLIMADPTDLSIEQLSTARENIEEIVFDSFSFSFVLGDQALSYMVY